MKFKALPKQREFLRTPKDVGLDVSCYLGGVGSGKTYSGSMRGFLLSQKYPGSVGLIGAETYPMVRDTTLISYFEHFDAAGYKAGVDYVYNKSDQIIQFKNNSKILIRHFKEPEKLKSLNLDWIEVEEMSQIPESTFKMLLSRLRNKNIDIHRLFGHTNPEENKGWIYNYFVEEKRDNYRLIKAPTHENVFLPKHYIEELRKAYDEDYYNIYVLGQFGDYSKGLVTKGFNENKQIININYLDDIDLYLTCDFNRDPMCWQLCHLVDGKFYYFDEICLEDCTTKRAALAFIERYPQHKAQIIITGDASGAYLRCENESHNYMMMLNIFKEHGYKKVKLHIRDGNPHIEKRVAAWNSKIKNSNNEHCIYISPKCKQLLYNIRNLKYHSGTRKIYEPTIHEISKDSSLKFLGHPFDAASYLVEILYPIQINYSKPNKEGLKNCA